MTRVYWTPEARSRPRSIYHYIELDSPKVAKAVVQQLLAPSRQLEAAPFSGRKVPEYQRNDIRELLERPYRIAYRFAGSRVTILPVITTGSSCPATSLCPRDSAKTVGRAERSEAQ